MSANRLRAAFDAEPVPRDLEARVRARLERTPSIPAYSWYPRLISSLALLGVMAAGLQYYSISESNRLLRVGVADHHHCGIEGAYPRQAQRSEMITALGPYSLMLQPILDQMPRDPVVSAHRCTINGRDYVHFIVRSGAAPGSTMISVIMTKKAKDEFYPRSFANALQKKSAIIMHHAELDGYSVSGFTAGGYLGYVVSSLPANENEGLAAKIAPVIRRYTGA